MCGRVHLLFRGGILEAERYLRVDSVDGSVDEARRDRIRDDIARRVRASCSHLAEDEFGQLVEKMTDRQIKGERRAARDFLLE